MILPISVKENKPREIDLTAPEGNAFCMIGLAISWAKQCGFDHDEISRDMMSGDYNHLIEVFERHFGDLVIMYK